MKRSLEALPNELLLEVVSNLDANDALMLALTNKKMELRLRSEVIKRDLKGEAVVLMFAAWNGSVETFRCVEKVITGAEAVLIKQALNKPVKVQVLQRRILGANFHNDVEGEPGETFVLNLACWNGHATLTGMLLEAGALPTNRDSGKNNTALHHALDPHCARLLVEAGADIDAIGQDNYTPITSIIRTAGLMDVIAALTHLPEPVNYTYPNVTATVRYLLNDAGADTAVYVQDIQHPVNQATFWLLPEIVRVLVEGGVALPLRMYGSQPFMDYLDERVRDAAGETDDPVQFRNALSIVGICVEAGGAAREIIHTLVSHVHNDATPHALGVMARVIARLDNIDVQDATGQTPLMLSMLNGHHQISSMLMHHGADFAAALFWYHQQPRVNTGCLDIDCHRLGRGRTALPS